MALIIEAINEVYSLENNQNVKLFLAGGISNCPDWQSELLKKLIDFPRLTIYNPRRTNFPIDNPKATEEQITWEFNHLAIADMIVFWFSKGSLNPIVLYELGLWGNSSDIPIFVGIDKGYERSQDVRIQTKLARPGLTIYEDLYSIACEIEVYVESNFKRN